MKGNWSFKHLKIFLIYFEVYKKGEVYNLVNYRALLKSFLVSELSLFTGNKRYPLTYHQSFRLGEYTLGFKEPDEVTSF